jgi:hypothetical protein
MDPTTTSRRIPVEELIHYARTIADELQTSPVSVATTCADNPQLFSVVKDRGLFLIKLR